MLAWGKLQLDIATAGDDDLGTSEYDIGLVSSKACGSIDVVSTCALMSVVVEMSAVATCAFEHDLSTMRFYLESRDPWIG